jgi:hypothetical protein
VTPVNDRGEQIRPAAFGPGDSRAKYARNRVSNGLLADAATPASHAAGRAGNRAVRKKPNRSHSAVGAAIVAGAAMVATFAFILTNGNSSPPSSQSNLPPVVAPESSAPPAPAAAEKPSANSAPAPAVSTAKADRKPPASKHTSAAPPSTGPESPVFKRGQWIAVLDTYPTDAGLEADQLAKQLAGNLIKAGVPAKAMLANGQYPGVSNSTLEAVTDTWIVYLGPLSSAEAALNLCQSSKTQKAYSSPACPTYEPAATPG